MVSAPAAVQGAVVLAAGRSTRMGPINKLLAPLAGRPMVRAVVDELEGSSARPVVVVTGYEADRVEKALGGTGVRLVHNPEYREGLSGSIRTGIMALPESAQAAVICLGDMPLVTSKHVDKLVAAFDPAEGREICVPVFEGKRGNPVLFARRFFEEIAAVRGDVGARHPSGQSEAWADSTGSASAARPCGAPASAQAASSSIWRWLRRRSFWKWPKPGTAYQGGMRRSAVTRAIIRARRFAPS